MVHHHHPAVFNQVLALVTPGNPDPGSQGELPDAFGKGFATSSRRRQARVERGPAFQ